jgi:hypothetical protein
MSAQHPEFGGAELAASQSTNLLVMKCGGVPGRMYCCDKLSV